MNVKKPKTVFKRPWLHHVIIIVYIAAPFVNIILVKLFLNVPFSVIFSGCSLGMGSSQRSGSSPPRSSGSPCIS